MSFIGKEKDIESNLGDFGVRKYDNEIGRFTSIDPLWEKYYSWTPYHYCSNNPVSFLDVTGSVVIAADENAIKAIVNSVEQKFRANIGFSDNGTVYFKETTGEPNVANDLSNFTNYRALQTLAWSPKETFTISTNDKAIVHITETNTDMPIDLDDYKSSGIALPRKSSGENNTSSGGNIAIINPTIYQTHLTKDETTNNSGRAVAHELYGHLFLWYYKTYKGWNEGISHDGKSGEIIREAEKNAGN